MRIGIHFSPAGHQQNDIDELVGMAARAKDLGLDLWVPQLTSLDALSALAAVAREVEGVLLGTAVVPTYPRHPLVMASAALTVQAASGNRLTLGIGLSHKVVIEGVFGMSYDKPVRHMREYLEILVPALTTGEVSFEGETLSAHTFSAVRVAGAQAPKVVIAALGSQMLNLAGRLTDGTALWMVGPRTIAEHIVPKLSAAAQAAGRPAPEVVVGLPLCVTSDPDAARQRAAKAFGFYANLPSYRAMLDLEGASNPAEVAIVGDDETVAASLEHLGEIGATRLSLPVFGSAEEQERSLKLLGDLAATHNRSDA
jgi:F420-dependent oxidoreductase-like protein